MLHTLLYGQVHDFVFSVTLSITSKENEKIKNKNKVNKNKGLKLMIKEKNIATVEFIKLDIPKLKQTDDR